MHRDSEDTDLRIEQATPEAAARAIAEALRFLGKEADKVGMARVSELIAQASDEALEFARTAGVRQ